MPERKYSRPVKGKEIFPIEEIDFCPSKNHSEGKYLEDYGWWFRCNDCGFWFNSTTRDIITHTTEGHVLIGGCIFLCENGTQRLLISKEKGVLSTKIIRNAEDAALIKYGDMYVSMIVDAVKENRFNLSIHERGLRKALAYIGLTKLKNDDARVVMKIGVILTSWSKKE